MTLTPNTKYTIEVQVTLNSAFGSNDGIARVWVDGTLLYEEDEREVERSELVSVAE